MFASRRTGGPLACLGSVSIVAVALIAGGCASHVGLDDPVAAQRLAAQPSTRDIPQRVGRIGVGDKLKITVFGEPDLATQVEVAGSGRIALALIGEVDVKGRTQREAASIIAKRLASGFLNDPKVTVEIASYRPIYVHGEVRTGGELPFKGAMRIVDAVAAAGGFTYRAQESYVLLLREGEPGELRVPLPSELVVLPGDNIRVPERFF